MTELITAYYDFLSTAVPHGFGYLQFYPENAVPVDAVMPYGTYTITRNDMFQSGLDQIRLWSRSTGLNQVAGFMDSIDKAIPHGGIRMELENGRGAIAIYRGQPFMQLQPTDQIDLRIAYINVEIHNYIL